MTPTYTAEQRSTLLAIATDAIHDTLTERPLRGGIDVDDDVLRQRAATFVTLERDVQLLGCIGSLEPSRPLADDVARNAVAAAFRDPRLPPVTDDDYVAMSIEISVLSEVRALEVDAFDGLSDALEPGVDGLVIDVGPRRATFLPAVWRHFGDDSGAFLDALWRKAGLAPRAWPHDLRCSRYTAEKLIDPGPRSPVRRG